MKREEELTVSVKHETEPFGYWVEHKLAEPVFLRKPAYIPDGPNYTVTPLYAHPPKPAEVSTGFPYRATEGADELDELLDQYFSIGYQQGKEGRNHDDIHGSAQATIDKIRACFSHNRKIPATLKATEGGAHEKGLIAPRAGSFGVDWHEQWLKMRKSYHALKHAAARVIAETDRIHDKEPWPIKYRAPYEAITVLRAALTAKQTDGRGE